MFLLLSLILDKITKLTGLVIFFYGANISTVVYVLTLCFFMYLSPFVNANIISSLKPHSYFLTSLDEDNQSFYEGPWRNTILGI